MAFSWSEHFASMPVVLVAGLLTATPQPAEAWYYGGHHYRHYGHKYLHSGGHHRSYSAYRGLSGYRPGGQGHNYSGHGTDCHSVNKIGYDDGYKAKITGTQCYDEYGKAYIVPGSRYVLKRY
jgi:hypothetical protein